MKITIDNESDLGGYQEFLWISPNKRTIPYTIRAIVQHYKGDDKDEIEIWIHRSLFPFGSSYVSNPAQLAKNTGVNTFTYRRGQTKGEYIALTFTNKEKAPHFWRQCLDYCQLEGTHVFAFDEVPITYRHTPSLLRWRLKQATGKHVRVIRTSKLFKLVVPKGKVKYLADLGDEDQN